MLYEVITVSLSVWKILKWLPKISFRRQVCLLNSLRLFFATVLLCGWVGAGELQGALHYLNTLRQQSGLIPFKENVQLNRAASNHASYLLRQQNIGHYETRGYNGFTGQTPSDRVILSGYHSKDVMENVSINAHTPKESIENRITSYNVCYTKLLRCFQPCFLPSSSTKHWSLWDKRV